MCYWIKTVKDKAEVIDYAVHGNAKDLTQAVQELEGKGELIITICEEKVENNGRPYTGGGVKRK